MFDFSQLKSLIIPEGNVTQIKVGDNVLWTKPKPKKLTIDSYNTDNFAVSVGGVSYNNTTLTVPVGSVVEISAFNLYCPSCKRDGKACVYLNDNLVAEEAESITYSYKVTGDVTINAFVYPNTHSDCSHYNYYGNIYITEQ